MKRSPPATASAARAASGRSGFTLYDATLAQNPACWMVHTNLGIALVDAGRVEEARHHRREAGQPAR